MRGGLFTHLLRCSDYTFMNPLSLMELGDFSKFPANSKKHPDYLNTCGCAET